MFAVSAAGLAAAQLLTELAVQGCVGAGVYLALLFVLTRRNQCVTVGHAGRRQVLLEFPIEVLSALVAGRWAASASAVRPFLAGYQLRLGMAAIVTALVRSGAHAILNSMPGTVQYFAWRLFGHLLWANSCSPGRRRAGPGHAAISITLVRLPFITPAPLLCAACGPLTGCPGSCCGAPYPGQGISWLWLPFAT